MKTNCFETDLLPNIQIRLSVATKELDSNNQKTNMIVRNSCNKLMGYISSLLVSCSYCTRKLHVSQEKTSCRIIVQVLSSFSAKNNHMLIRLIAHSRQVKNEIKETMLLYDFDKKKLVEKQGGRMELKYDFKTRKLVPNIVPDYVFTTESTWNSITEWVKRKGFEIYASFPPGAIDAYIDQDRWYGVEQEIRKLGFRYDVLEDEDREDYDKEEPKWQKSR